MYLGLTCNYVAKAGFELLIPFPSSPKCWDHRCIPLRLLCSMLYSIRESRSPLKLSHITEALLPLLLLQIETSKKTAGRW